MTDTTTSAPEEETLALPGDGLREGIVDELRRRIGEALVDSELRPNDDLWVRVATGAWADTGRALHAMGFTYFSFLSGLDWMPSPYGRGEDNPDEPPPERTTEVVQGVVGGDTRFQVFARVVDPVRHVGVTIKADVPDDDLRVESWHTIWAGANWHERETAEMFGIEFVGHPDLRHMYLPGDFEGFPLRKDFPLLSRMIKPWPGIVDVEPMPEEEAEEAAAEVTAGADAATTGDEAAATDDAAEAVADATTAPEPPTETEVASAPEEAADPADVTDRTEENAPDQEPAPEAEPVDATPEEPADPTPEDVPPAEAPADPTPEDPPAEPVTAPDEPARRRGRRRWRRRCRVDAGGGHRRRRPDPRGRGRLVVARHPGGRRRGPVRAGQQGRPPRRQRAARPSDQGRLGHPPVPRAGQRGLRVRRRRRLVRQRDDRPHRRLPLPLRRRGVVVTVLMAFPGHAGRCWPLARWRSLARTGARA